MVLVLTLHVLLPGLYRMWLHLWRRDPRFGPSQYAAMCLPVEVKPAETPPIPEPARAGGASENEIALASGHRLTPSGAFDVDNVLRLVSGLSAT